MLPATVQFPIALNVHAINERMARRVEYLLEEVRVLKDVALAATGKTRLTFTPAAIPASPPPTPFVLVTRLVEARVTGSSEYDLVACVVP